MVGREEMAAAGDQEDLGMSMVPHASVQRVDMIMTSLVPVGMVEVQSGSRQGKKLSWTEESLRKDRLLE